MAEPDANHVFMTLPEPTLVFTLPSIHDGLPLDCRVYHPLSLSPALLKNPQAPLSWRKHVAIVAHPYAPLGGCYDDPVVGVVASTLLRLGFLVMTFNFRGAHGSAGRTSWTAKAEKGDYMSAVGFLSYYVHFLDPFSRLSQVNEEASEPPPTADAPIFIMSGYSYGAMITTQLPYLSTILQRFDAPICLSHAAEIRLRAQHLAEGQNTVLSSARAAAIDRQSNKSPRKSLGLRIGGDEEIRSSHESRHSFAFDAEDRIRRGVAELMAKARKGHKRWHSHSDDSAPQSTQYVDQNGAGEQGDDEQHKQLPVHECLLPIPDRILASPAYLLISPLQGVITNLATMSFSGALSKASWKAFGRSTSTNDKENIETKDVGPSVQAETGVINESEDKLVRNPTFAIYGDRDGFVAARKLRDWASRLERVPDSQFRAHEVSNAGHFWNQGRVAYTMRDAVKAFAGGLLSGKGG